MKPIKVIYSGQFRDPSGYAQAARDYLKALDFIIKDGADIQLKVFPISFDPQRSLSASDDALITSYEFADNQERDAFIADKDFIFLGHQTPNAFSEVSELDIFRDHARHLINMTVWETSHLPEAWIDLIKESKINSFIVPCEWNKEIFEADTGLPASVLPHVINTGAGVDDVSDRIIPGKFNVLSVSHWIYRKGFDALIKAYLMEFYGQEDAVFILKSYRTDSSEEEQAFIKSEIKRLRAEVFVGAYENSDALIYFIGDLLTATDMGRLYQGCDLFALASRGEGFGLPYTEAITHGKPVLCPDRGGHIDYIDKKTAYLVDGSMQPCHTQGVVFTANMDWFEPSVKSIREQLRRAYDDWKDGRIADKGKAAREYIKAGGYSYPEIGQRLYDILKKAGG